MKSIVITSILGLSLSLPLRAGAQAQPAAPAPQAELPALQLQPASPAVAATADAPAQKSPGAATAWALSTTALSVGMLAGGLMEDKGNLALLGLLGLTIGPSFGHFYAGDAGRAWGQMGLRAGALGAMYTGVVVTLGECGLFTGEEGCTSTSGNILLLGGLAIGAGSVVYSIYDAPRAAKRYNARQQRLTFTPAPITGPDRTSGLGLQLAGSF